MLSCQQLRNNLVHDSTLWKLQEDNDTWKLTVKWKRNNGVDEIHWPSSCTHRKHMITIQDEFKKEKDRKLSTFSFGAKVGMRVVNIGINYQTCS